MKRWIPAAAVAACCCTAARAAAVKSIPLDIGGSLNYDLWISNEEAGYAISLDSLVSSVFGQHSYHAESGRSYAFQDQVAAGRTGLPLDGRITKVVEEHEWTFQLHTVRGVVPEGGYDATNRPTVPNIVWTSTQSGSEQTVLIPLAPEQQRQYAAVNFLFNADGHKENIRYLRIDALYGNGENRSGSSPPTSCWPPAGRRRRTTRPMSSPSPPRNTGRKEAPAAWCATASATCTPSPGR